MFSGLVCGTSDPVYTPHALAHSRVPLYRTFLKCTARSDLRFHESVKPPLTHSLHTPLDASQLNKLRVTHKLIMSTVVIILNKNER